MIYVLYGQPESGKTTLSKLLSNHLINKIIASAAFSPKIPVIIDGDEFRELLNNADYSREGREINIRSANTVATYISKSQSRDVIMALVNPYKHLRQELADSNDGKVVEILLQSKRSLKKDYHVKDFEKGEPDYFLLTDSKVEETWENLKELLNL